MGCSKLETITENFDKLQTIIRLQVQRFRLQKEGQEDQGTLKQLLRAPLTRLPLPGPPGLPSGSPGLLGTPSN